MSYKRVKLTHAVVEAKSSARSSDDDYNLSQFLAWLKERNFKVSEKVKISKEGCCARYGLLAVNDIAEGECLFEVPRSAVLWQRNNAFKDPDIAKAIQNLESDSGWVPLLVTLLLEFLNLSSPWRPYLNFTLNLSGFQQPMFWDRSEMYCQLSATGVSQSVDKDIERMKLEYEGIVEPFIEKYSQYFGSAIDFELYQKFVAFVMSYSFSDEGRPPVMVPMADILNGKPETMNNASLNFEKNHLEMRATKPIKKGEEIFNSYGEVSNAELLHLYGFALPSTVFDEALIPCSDLLNAYQTMSDLENGDLLRDKWTFLTKNVITEEDFIVGPAEIATKGELMLTLKVLFMDKEEFRAYSESWCESMEEEEDDDEQLKSVTPLQTLPMEWKLLLKRFAENHLENYGVWNSVDEMVFEDQEKLNNLANDWPKFAIYVRYGQKKIVRNFINYLG